MKKTINGFYTGYDTQKRAKYTNEDAESIKGLLLEGLSIREISKATSIPYSSVYNIMKRNNLVINQCTNKPSLHYLSRQECKTQHEITDSQFDYIRTAHEEFTVKVGGKVFVHVNYFYEHKFNSLGYKESRYNSKKDKP